MSMLPGKRYLREEYLYGWCEHGLSGIQAADSSRQWQLSYRCVIGTTKEMLKCEVLCRVNRKSKRGFIAQTVLVTCFYYAFQDKSRKGNIFSFQKHP